VYPGVWCVKGGVREEEGVNGEGGGVLGQGPAYTRPVRSTTAEQLASSHSSIESSCECAREEQVYSKSEQTHAVIYEDFCAFSWEKCPRRNPSSPHYSLYSIRTFIMCVDDALLGLLLPAEIYRSENH
jgi:hypothetical protein